MATEANGAIISGDDAVNSKKAMAHALCKHLSLDPNTVSSTTIEESDVFSLFCHIVKSPEDKVLKFVEEFTKSFPGKDGDRQASLIKLNEDLSQKAVVLGYGAKSSVADIVAFATVYPFVSHCPSDSDLQKYTHLIRWMDYIQNVEDFGQTLEKILVNKPKFDPPSHPKKEKTDPDLGSKKGASGQKDVGKSEGSTDSKKVPSGQKNVDKSEGSSSSKNVAAENKPSTEDKANPATVKNNMSSEQKKKAPESTAEKESECSISILNIQVGHINKAWKHPSADSLLVEEIDLGDGNVRQVVSGLAKYCSPEELTDRHVVLITNVKPGKLRDVMSAGLVLCASNEDHTKVEPLIPPEGAKIGERVSFAGHDGKPEDVLNPKKKQLEKITPHLFTDENGIATFKGIPFTTSAGPCRSTIPKASIK